MAAEFSFTPQDLDEVRESCTLLADANMESLYRDSERLSMRAAPGAAAPYLTQQQQQQQQHILQRFGGGVHDQEASTPIQTSSGGSMSGNFSGLQGVLAEPSPPLPPGKYTAAPATATKGANNNGSTRPGAERVGFRTNSEQGEITTLANTSVNAGPSGASAHLAAIAGSFTAGKSAMSGVLIDKRGLNQRGGGTAGSAEIDYFPERSPSAATNRSVSVAGIGIGMGYAIDDDDDDEMETTNTPAMALFGDLPPSRPQSLRRNQSAGSLRVLAKAPTPTAVLPRDVRADSHGSSQGSSNGESEESEGRVKRRAMSSSAIIVTPDNRRVLSRSANFSQSSHSLGALSGGGGSTTRHKSVSHMRADDIVRMLSMAHRGPFIDQQLLTYVRAIFLEILRVRYWHDIERGKIPRLSHSAKFLLYSVEVGVDEVDQEHGAQDWRVIRKEITELPLSIRLLMAIDSCTLGYSTYYLGKLEARREKRAVYMLNSFIDAHEHAQAKVHEFIAEEGEEEDSYVQSPEELKVIEESKEAVSCCL